MRVSKTKFEDFGCPRRGQYKHIKKIELIDATDLSLVYGSAIHKGFDKLFSLWGNLDLDPVGAAQDAFKNEFSKYTGPPDPKGRRHEQAGLDTLSAFAEQWLQRYPWEDVEGEKKYVMELPNEDGSKDEFVCIIDRRGKLGGVPTILEFKTTSWPHLFTIDPNIQVESQALTLAVNLGVLEYLDVLFLLIHVDERAKGGFIVPKTKARAGTEPQSIFRPLPITLSREKLNETEKDIRARIAFMKLCESRDYYPKITERCGDFGGCPYKRLCVLKPEDRGIIEATQYKPITYQTEKEVVAE